MHPKRTTIICARCGESLPRESFQHIERPDRPGRFRLDALCLVCRPIRDAGREARRRTPNTTITCGCGCGRLTNPAPITDERRGWVAGQPMRFLKGHNARTTPYPDAPYLIDEETGCWIWQLSLDDDGYGRLFRDGRTRRAHRVFYEDRFGPLPDGMVPDHCCPHGPNRACVNPDHMRPLTVEDNSRWKQSTVLDWDKAADIRALAGVLPQSEIAELFGVSQGHISDIVNGKSWAA